MEKYICKICGGEFSKSGLAKHYSKKHNLSREQIYDCLYPEEMGTHICPICGNHIKINKRELKYNRFCSVRCAQQYNWSNSEKKERQSKNLRSFWSDESKCLGVRKHMQEIWENKTDEEKKVFHDKSSKSHKLMFQNKTPEELKEWRDNISKGKKLLFASYSEEQMNNFSQIRKLVWSSKTPEEQQEWISKIKSTWVSKSQEELGELSNKISSAWISKTNEKKLESVNKRRINNLSLEQYEILHDKDKFKQYLIEYKDNNGDYPTPINLTKEFNFSNSSGVLNYIHQYNLEDYVSWDKSLPEQGVYDYIKSVYGGEIFTNNRNTLRGNKELDIYIPEKNLAIEFNGCYWHSKLWKDNHYHQNKSKECLSKGIRLIHIYEDEWIYKRDIIKDILKTALGVFENKIYARKCEVRVVDKQTYKDYCQKYHLQGYSPAQIILGLYYQDQLIQLASFSKSRYDKNYEDEWIRGVQLPGYQIVGGTSKLFKYFIKNYNPESIICYSDFNKFTGNSYKNCGFILDKITTPDMWFIGDGLKRINRQPSKHQLTKKLVESGDLLEMHGAGNMKWVWRKP